jgi:hypothetical protein
MSRIGLLKTPELGAPEACQAERAYRGKMLTIRSTRWLGEAFDCLPNEPSYRRARLERSVNGFVP